MKNFFSNNFLYILAASCASAFFFTTSVACAAGAETKAALQLVSPWKARFSFHGARLEVGQTVPINENAGLKNVQFVIPDGAKNLEISIAGANVARWTSEPVILNESSGASNARKQAQTEKDHVAASIAAIAAVLAVWENQTAPANPRELEERQAIMQKEIPGLALQREELSRRLAMVNRQLDMMPETEKIAQKIIATLASTSRAGETLNINYAYDLENCGWLPQYYFNAITRDSKNYRLSVKMGAEIWQYGGLDWNGTEITLATQGTGPREPRPLQKWVVGENQPQPKAYDIRERPLMAGVAANKSAKAMDAATEAAAGIATDTASVYATWTLPEKGLPEGKSRIAILEEEWKATLEWLARPSTENSRVWLLSRLELPTGKAWPAGKAQFGIDGQNVGSGSFAPREREISLYFGADPRVNVTTTVDSNKRGQTGFINTNKTWTGAWTYTISNEHDEAIRVKVERPAPMPANEKIKVSYKDTPPATVDEKKHMLSWEVETPAHGTAIIEHSVTISSPEDFSIYPNIP